MIVDLAADPRAKRTRNSSHMLAMVEGTRELISPECPDDLADTFYGRWLIETGRATRESCITLIEKQQKLARRIAADGYDRKTDQPIQVVENSGHLYVVNGCHRVAILIAMGRECPARMLSQNCRRRA